MTNELKTLISDLINKIKPKDKDITKFLQGKKNIKDTKDLHEKLESIINNKDNIELRTNIITNTLVDNSGGDYNIYLKTNIYNLKKEKEKLEKTREQIEDILIPDE